MKVLLLAPNASFRMGGEACLALHWLRELSNQGVDVRLLTHARCRVELQASRYSQYPIEYLEDSPAERLVWRLTNSAPGPLVNYGKFTLSFVTLIRLAGKAREIVDAEQIDIVHQTQPVSPRLPSPLTCQRARVVIGPMNGNMEFPPGFDRTHGSDSRRVVHMARRVTNTMHYLFNGKLKAQRLLVANQRTAQALPPQTSDIRVVELVENGVDLEEWSDADPLPSLPNSFIFIGSLIKWKGADQLLSALALLDEPATLTLCGDGPERENLQQMALAMPRIHTIDFLGRVTQQELREQLRKHRALVLPSLYECGGAVVLEAMAMKRAVIATRWGGPADYVTPETGILIQPDAETFVAQLSAAMKRLSGSPDTARRMGEAGRERVVREFSWRAKAARMMSIYKELMEEPLAS